MTRLSLAKDRVRILLLEGVHDNAVADFAAESYANVIRLPGALSEDELRQRIEAYLWASARARRSPRAGGRRPS